MILHYAGDCGSSGDLPKNVLLCIHISSPIVTKTINIRESAYNALKAQKRAGESYSDVILRIIEGEEKGVCEFLETVDPDVRKEIARSVRLAKSELDRASPRKVSF